MNQNDEPIMRIPLDPERMVFSQNEQIAAIQKNRHYACCIIGLHNLGCLEKRGLRVVPKEVLDKYLEWVAPEFVNGAGNGSTPKDR